MIELSFDAVAAKVRTWYREDKLSHQEIAQKLIADGIAPVCGHEAWTWRSVDSVLVLAASQRQARDTEAQG